MTVFFKIVDRLRVAVFVLTIFVCAVGPVSAQRRPPPYRPYHPIAPWPFWDPLAPSPSQMVPPYSGAIPSYYYQGRPVYDYASPSQPRFGLPPLVEYRDRPDMTRSRMPDAGGQGIRTEIRTPVRSNRNETVTSDNEPQQVESKPVSPMRNWTTKKGEVIENASILDFINGRIVLCDGDGKWHRVFPADLDEDGLDAFKQWRLLRKKQPRNDHL